MFGNVREEVFSDSFDNRVLAECRHWDSCPVVKTLPTES